MSDKMILVVGATLLCAATSGCGSPTPKGGETDTESTTSNEHSSDTSEEPETDKPTATSDTGIATSSDSEHETATADTVTASATVSSSDSQSEETTDTNTRPAICQGVIPALEFGVMAAGATKGSESTWDTDGCFASDPSAAGPEEIWRLEVTEPSEVTLAAQVVDTDYDLVLKILSECSTEPGVKIACDDNTTAGGPEQIATPLDTGTYFVVVDGWKAEDKGVYTLSATRSALPAGAACFAPLDASMGFQTGNTKDAYINTPAACDPSGVNSGRDQVWRFFAAANGWIQATMNTVGENGGFACQLSVRSACTVKSSELSCDNDNATNADEICSVVFPVEAGQDYFLLAGTHRLATQGGEYALILTTALAPRNGDVCAAARTATVGINSGDSTGMADDYSLSICNSTSGADEVWKFVAPDTGDYRVTMDSSTLGGFNTVVAVWQVCGASGALVCDNPSPDSPVSEVTFEATKGATYFILADADDPGDPGGRYSLVINRLAPATCEGTPSECTDIGSQTMDQAKGCCSGAKLYRCADPYTFSSTDCGAMGLVCGYDLATDAMACL